MWMVFNSGTVTFIERTAGNVSCVDMLNGTLCVGKANGHYLSRIEFILDKGMSYSSGNEYTHGGKTVADRNVVSDTRIVSNTEVELVNATVNDVAMTVLPNAPIDAATGLPVPTIAVATDGGVSVIKDDGTVVDIAFNSYGFNTVDFQGTEHILAGTRNLGSGGSALYVNVYPIPSSDVGATMVDEFIISRSAGTDNGASASIRVPFGNGGYDTKSDNNKTSFIATDEGLLHYTPSFNDTTATSSMGVGVTSTYNTGWMNGDIKLATLSDTDDTDVTGSELVTNGDFSSTLGAEWDLSTGSGTIAIVSGQLEITQGGSSSVMYASQDFTTVSGKTYTLSFKVVATTEANYFRVKVGTYANATNLGVTSTLTAAGEYSITFTATGSTSWVTLHSDQNANKKTTWDNISVRLAEEDRSVNANGLQVFGTITKTAVATGADLVAYTGFSSSNFMVQPYNSDLDFGTGDFSIMGWINVGSSVSPYASILSRVLSANSETNAWSLRIDSSANNYYLYTNNASVFTSPVTRLTWQFLTVARRSGVVYFYVNGAFRTTGPMANTITNVGACVVVGYESTHNMGNSSVALWRISATAPSAEQIAKIYEDEKYLFQENAQATLYGSSDAVTALAYDDTTELLHVGTSQGRSVFQGLRRVDNTTSAVGAAISASNGLVAED
jgi:trimeric autotransporter adhesin